MIYYFKSGIPPEVMGIPFDFVDKPLIFVRRFLNHGLPVIEFCIEDGGKTYMAIESYLEKR